jgi:hypothetical protein
MAAVVDVHELIDVVAAVESTCRDGSTLRCAVAAAARLRSWLDGRDVQLAAQLADVVSFPAQELAGATRCSLREAERVVERSRTVERIPALGDALDAGVIGAAHVDVLGRAWRQLEPGERRALVDRSGTLVELASRSTADELQRAVAAELREIRRDDGIARLEQQRRATRLRTWVDGEGMWCLSGRFDPEKGLQLHGRLSAAVETLFAEVVPDHCPSDPVERQGFLRAHALVALTQGRVAGRGRPEVVVVIDTRAPDADGRPAVDWGLPVELPAEVLRELFGAADVSPVVVRDGVVLHAPGCLDLGRTTRLAGRAQRRALRALYPSCAIPGCDVRFELCKLHHVVWWEHGGATDLVNLLPLCVVHHHLVHDRGWQLRLTAGRRLTITYPDGTQQETGPPQRGRPTEARRRSDRRRSFAARELVLRL